MLKGPDQMWRVLGTSPPPSPPLPAGAARRPPKCKFRHSKYKLRHSKYKLRHSKYKFRHPKFEFWDSKLSVEIQNWLFRIVFKSQMISKYILTYSWIFPAQFPYKRTRFSIKSTHIDIKTDILIKNPSLLSPLGGLLVRNWWRSVKAAWNLHSSQY